MNKEDFEKQYFSYLLWDNPILYKGLLIYPVIMKNYLPFIAFSQSISKDKNSVVTDNPKLTAKLIGMSYLDYLFYCAESDDLNSDIFIYSLELLLMCLHIKINQIKCDQVDKNKHHILIINQNNKDISIDSNDFDNIRHIICYQNGIELEEDDKTPPKIKAKLEEAEKIKLQKEDFCNLEDQIICLMISTSLNLEYIEKMSIRKFNKAIKRVSYKMDYQINKTAERSGFAKFEKPVKYWMCNLDKKDKYADVKIDYNGFMKDMKFDKQKVKVKTNK